MPASLHNPQVKNGNPITGSFLITDAFPCTFSSGPAWPSRSKRSAGAMGTLMSATPGKSLRTLTRQTSRGLGTIPGSNRKRLVSLAFEPPFKK